MAGVNFFTARVPLLAASSEPHESTVLQYCT